MLCPDDVEIEPKHWRKTLFTAMDCKQTAAWNSHQPSLNVAIPSSTSYLLKLYARHV